MQLIGKRPVQYGVAKVNVAGGEAAPYDVVIGNTNPGSTKEIISEVLQKVALQVIEELKPQEPLQILEVECLTKSRDWQENVGKNVEGPGTKQV